MEKSAFDDKSEIDPDDTADLDDIEILDTDPNITYLYTQNMEKPAFDDRSDDTADLDNIEVLNIDPNITSTEFELYEKISFKKHLKYPNKNSQNDIWLLPSGKSIKEVIRGPENLHKSQ